MFQKLEESLERYTQHLEGWNHFLQLNCNEEST